MKGKYVLFGSACLVVALAAVIMHFASATASSVLVPTSEGNYLQWTPSTGTTHYTLVDETNCNGTTDYNSTATVNNKDSYGVSISSVGDGAIISKVALVPCASNNTSGGSSTLNVFYRWNGSDSSATGSYALSGTTPTGLATSTYSSLNLFKTSTSVLEIGAVLSAGTKGARLSRIATVLTYTLTAPTTASALVATNTSSSANSLAWTDNSNNELGFKIYRSQNGGSYSQIATTTLNAVSYSNTGLTADQTYTYYVVAYNSNGGNNSNTSNAVTYFAAPAAPSGLLLATSVGSFTLTWTDSSTNEDGFKVERSTDNVSFSQVATTTLNIGSSTTSYTDTVSAGTYYYRVRAYNTKGNSAYSNTATNDTSIPAAPSNLSTATSSGNVILTWSDNSANESGFKIERSTDNVTYAQIATTTANSTNTASYTDSGASGTPYYYRVRAYNASGSSGYATAVEGIYTVIASSIYVNTTWTSSNIYRVTGTLSVTGSKLTIQAGTIVKFDAGPTGISVTSTGVLSVQGTNPGTIYFTSMKDDAVGGDTNGDTTSTSPNANDWNTIELDYGASSTISNALIRYGGYAGLGTDVYNHGGTLTLDTVEISNAKYDALYQDGGTGMSTVTNCNIHSNANYIALDLEAGSMTVQSSNIHDNATGIYSLSSGTLTVNGNTFSNVSRPGAIALDNGLTFIHSGNTSSGSEKHGFYISGSVNGSQELTAGDIPYIISGITIPSGNTLTVDHGAVLKFDLGVYWINVSNGGALRVQGTSASSVYFTSLHDDSVGGDTDNVSTAPQAGDWDTINLASGASSTIVYTNIRYGGNHSCCGGSASGANVYNNGGTLTLDNSTVATGVYYSVYHVSGTSNITASTLYGQPGYYGVEVDGGTANISASTNIHGNAVGLYSPGGTVNVTGSSIHDNSSMGIHVAGGAATVNSTVISNGGYGAYIDGGSLAVVSSVIHDSSSDGINMSGPAILTVSSTEIATSTSDGIYQGNGTSTIFASYLHDNAYGIDFEAGSINVTENIFRNNTTYALDNTTGNVIGAPNNWWNSYSGPYPQGLGDPISANIDPSQWHSDNGHWSVRASALKWFGRGNTKYGGEIDNGLAVWRSTATGVITIAEMTATADAQMVVIADDPVSELWDGQSSFTTSTGVPDTIQFSAPNMDSYPSDDYRQHVTTHEFGHALGLGHSYTGNIMVPVTDNSIALGLQDVSDFHYWWETIRWAVSKVGWPL